MNGISVVLIFASTMAVATSSTYLDKLSSSNSASKASFWLSKKFLWGKVKRKKKNLPLSSQKQYFSSVMNLSSQRNFHRAIFRLPKCSSQVRRTSNLLLLMPQIWKYRWLSKSLSKYLTMLPTNSSASEWASIFLGEHVHNNGLQRERKTMGFCLHKHLLKMLNKTDFSARDKQDRTIGWKQSFFIRPRLFFLIHSSRVGKCWDATITSENQRAAIVE